MGKSGTDFPGKIILALKSKTLIKPIIEQNPEKVNLERQKTEYRNLERQNNEKPLRF
jgi:hypothetical protein